MDKLLSVIIPVYNAEKYLHECVDSIINQTYKNLEIILVDDGSPDNCGQICDEYAKRDKRVKVIHQENRGQGGARNHGLKCATGEYITFVDSDDYVLEETFDTCMQIMGKEGFDFFSFHGFSSGKGRTGSGKIVELDARKCWEDSIKYEGTLAWGPVMKRELWNGVFYPENQKFEDTPVSYRIWEKVKKPGCIDKTLYYYRKNPNGTCSTSGLKPEARYGYVLSSEDRLEYAIAHHVGEVEARATLLKAILSYFTAVYGTKAEKGEHYYRAVNILKTERKKPYNAALLNPKYKAYLWCCGRLDFVHYIGARLSYFSKIAEGYGR